MAVKAFSRPAAGQPPPLPSDVRPPRILVTTLHYLIDNIVPQLPKSHTFLWDRTRSIRQDFTYQNYIGPEAILCNELIARIHILSLHVMLTSDVEYSKQQEIEQFNKTLQTLSELYNANRKLNSNFRSPKEPEFRAYQLLSHIYDPEVAMQIQSLPSDILSDPRLQLAITLRTLVQHTSRSHPDNPANLFASFFRTLTQNTKIPFLFLCLLETHFQDIRTNALVSMSKAYHHRGSPYIISRLSSMLGFTNDIDTIAFCTNYGLKIVEDEQYGTCVNVTTDPKNLTPSTNTPPTYNATFIDARKGSHSWSDCIYSDPAVSSSAQSFVSPMAARIMTSKSPGNNTIPEAKIANPSFSSPFMQSTNGFTPPQTQPFKPSVPLFGASQPKQQSQPQSSNVNLSPIIPQQQASSVSSIFNSVSSNKQTPIVPNIFQNVPNGPTPTFSNISAPTGSTSAFGPRSQIFSGSGLKPVPSGNSNSNSLFSSPQPTSFQKPSFPSSSNSLPKFTQSSEILQPGSAASVPFQSIPASIPSVGPTATFSSPSIKPPQPTNSQTLPHIKFSQPLAPQPSKPKITYKYTQDDVEQEAKRILNLFVLRSLRESIIPNSWEEIQKQRLEEKKKQDEVCKKELNSLLHDILVDQAMTVKADQMNALRLKKLTVQKFSDAAYRVMIKAEEEKRRRNEYLRISGQLGRPRTSSSGSYYSSLQLQNKHKRSRSSLSRRIVTSSSTEKLIQQVTKSKLIAQKLWVPTDLSSVLVNSLEHGLRSAHIYGDTQLKFSSFCRDWDSTAGKWIKNKISLGSIAKSSSGSTSLVMEQLQTDEASYQNISQFALVCGLGPDGLPARGPEVITKYDKDALAAILSRIIPVSVYKIQLFLLSWSDLSQEKVLELLNISSYTKDLSSITICRISDSTASKSSVTDKDESESNLVDPSEELEADLADLGLKFTAELSVRGNEIKNQERLRQYKLRRERQNQTYYEKEQLEDEERANTLSKLQGMNSLKMFGELGKRTRYGELKTGTADSIGNMNSRIVNEPHIGSYPSTPIKQVSSTSIYSTPNVVSSPSQIEAINNGSLENSPSTPQLQSGHSNIDVPKGVRELRELVASVTKRNKFNDYN